MAHNQLRVARGSEGRATSYLLLAGPTLFFTGQNFCWLWQWVSDPAK
jgi:hypothetical protein